MRIGESDIFEGDIWPDPVHVMTPGTVGSRARIRAVALRTGKFCDGIVVADAISHLRVPPGMLELECDPNVFRLAIAGSPNPVAVRVPSWAS